MTMRGTNSYNVAIPYVPSGRLAASASNNGSVRLCIDEEVAKSRAITIIQSGRVRLAAHNSSGVPIVSGNAIEDCAT